MSRLILYGTYARGRLNRTNVAEEVEKARIMLGLTELGWGRENHSFMQVWATQFQPGGTLEHLRSWCEHQRLSASPAMAHRLLEVGFGADVVDLARLIRCPALIVHAEHDAMVPLHEGRLLANLIPDSRFVQLDSENHMPLEDEPSWLRFVEEAQRFLGEPDIVIGGRNGLPLGELTPREHAVLEAIAEGQDNTEIAASLGLSEKTVRNHITRVFDKIGVEHRYEAIVRAREAGLGQNSRLTGVR